MKSWAEAVSMPKCEVSHFRVENPFAHVCLYLFIYPGGVLWETEFQQSSAAQVCVFFKKLLNP